MADQTQAQTEAKASAVPSARQVQSELAAPPQHPLLRLQRSAGNTAVTELVQRLAIQRHPEGADITALAAGGLAPVSAPGAVDRARRGTAGSSTAPVRPSGEA